MEESNEGKNKWIKRHAKTVDISNLQQTTQLADSAMNSACGKRRIDMENHGIEKKPFLRENVLALGAEAMFTICEFCKHEDEDVIYGRKETNACWNCVVDMSKPSSFEVK